MIRWQTGKEIHLDIEHSKNYEHTVALVKTCFVSESDLRRLLANADRANPCMKCGSIQCALCSKDLERELWGDKEK